ncbi:MAG TPA: DUF4330 domain-containing protein, partial [Clostridia bacterium]|nr:DUF4330 domain-containing protein [Clostridia bacterium]
MKLIDDKGRIFGLINIIDLVVILLIILVAAGAYYKLTSSRSGTAAPKTVKFEVMVPHIRPEIAKTVKVGDKMVAGDSYQAVTVKDVEILPAYGVYTAADGSRVETNDPYLVDLFVTLEGKTVISGATINMGGQEIRVGRDYFVKSLTYEHEGT